MHRRTGEWQKFNSGEEEYSAYLPNPLPPVPPLDLVPVLGLLGAADRAVGKLDGLCATLPDSDLFLYMYIRKEAVLSSQIEGTQSSLSDLLLFENDQMPTVPTTDASEVSQYVVAMNHGLKRLRDDNFPLSLRLIREMHDKLLSHGRGAHLMPGEFRTTQNWIGGKRPANAQYVPPPPNRINEFLRDFETFLHYRDPSMPVLVKAALAHVQFETIHPFLDGNGRIGRLLIPFVLCYDGVLRSPILYPSLYFKQHRQRYYDLLQSVRRDGDWEQWVEFFLAGIQETAEQAVTTAQTLLLVAAEDRRRLDTLGRPRLSGVHVHAAMQRQPIFSIAHMAKATGLSVPAVTRSLAAMEKIALIERMPHQRRPQLFVYRRYLDILNQDTEPLPRD